MKKTAKLKDKKSKILKEYKMSKASKSNFKEKGITLIALIVTIIILLILAGVAIGTITGDNGLFRKSREATTLSKIATMEEEARMIYLGEQIGENEETSMSDVVSKLLQKGYEIEQKTSGEVSEISIDKSELTLSTLASETINITYKGSLGEIKYYAKIDDKYYEMKVKDGEIVISRESEEISESDNNLKIEVTEGKDKVAVTREGDNIKVTAGESTGTAIIKIMCGQQEQVTCNITIVTNTIPEFSTDYGLIDIIWLKDNSNIVSTSANKPNSRGLTPVTWTQNSQTKNWSEDSTAKSKWYDYSETNRYWANAKNADGSYFVWIPRYAYRITYYSDDKYQKVTGYYDGIGMYDAESETLSYKIDEGIETVDYNGMKYIVHPAFTGIGKEDNGGGFGIDSNGISGFWVAKFEMSMENSSDSGATWKTTETAGYQSGNIAIIDSNKNYIRAVSKPTSTTSCVTSWRYISIGNMYLNSYNYDRNKESHLMKNSEWGAVAYLTHSKYGRNGEEVTINNNCGYCIGIAADASYFGRNYKYNKYI